MLENESPESQKKDKRQKGQVKLKILGVGIFLFTFAIAFIFSGYKFAQRRLLQKANVTPTPTATLELVTLTPVLTFTPSPTPIVSPSPIFTPVASLSPTSVPSLTPTPVTATWETYTNSRYAYQFKHPVGWSFWVDISHEDSTLPLYVIREGISSNDIDSYTVLVRVWENPSRFSLTDWLQFMKTSGALPLPVETMDLTPNTTMAGVPALKFWSDPLSGGTEPGRCVQACPNLSVYFVNDDKAYEVQLGYTREVDDASRTTFDLLLSTFEFL